MTLLLIDADVLAYRAAAKHEVAEEVEPGYWTWGCDINKVKEQIEGDVKWLMEHLSADDYSLCVSDDHNFRKDIEPTYKGNRASTRRPVVLKPIRQWLFDNGAVTYPGLEGDDVMGILSTGDTIICSIDKDLKTIPGRFFFENKIHEITEAEADYWHLYQTLVGDTGDGYKGCPGIGPVNAKKVLESCNWGSVVGAYNSKGLEEDAAITQARLARILRPGEYDFETSKPRLWSPKNEV